MFVKLKKTFDKPIFTTMDELESFAGIDGKGVHHRRAWSPDLENFYNVIPKRYWDDFEFTLMTINNYILPHIDNDLITTINFYIQTDGGSGRTIFYEAKEQSKPWENKPKLEVNAENFNEGHVKYVGDLYNQDDVREIASFIAQDNEAWLLDVTKLHNVITNKNFKIRKALALRTKKYSYSQVYDMLTETGNL